MTHWQDFDEAFDELLHLLRWRHSLLASGASLGALIDIQDQLHSVRARLAQARNRIEEDGTPRVTSSEAPSITGGRPGVRAA